MLIPRSREKHLCSFSQVLEAKATAEILRFAQDDSRFIFSHLQREEGEGSWRLFETRRSTLRNELLHPKLNPKSQPRPQILTFAPQVESLAGDIELAANALHLGRDLGFSLLLQVFVRNSPGNPLRHSFLIHDPLESLFDAREV